MTNKKRIRFPILLKVILLGIIASFIAATVSIVVNFNNMKEREINELDTSANEALEYAYGFFDDPVNDHDNINSFDYIADYVTKNYQNQYDSIGERPVKDAELKYYSSFAEFEAVFKAAAPYFYVNGAFMTSDYPIFANNLSRIKPIVLNASFFCDQAAYFAIKDPDNENRFVFVFDSRTDTYHDKGTFYHCPATHYDIKPEDHIVDMGHEYIKGYVLDKYSTRFIEIKDSSSNVIGYIFIEYETRSVIAKIMPILTREIIILSLSSLFIIGLYALLSYLMFVKNVNKLDKAAKEISTKLKSNEVFSPIDPKITSHDEMKTLSDSFVAMENQIVNYVDIIKMDAREKEKINAELEIASKIQLEALPNAIYDDKQASIRAFIKPAKEVGGDFYDYFYLNDNELAIIISDVSGKGIPASLFMMKSKELIKSKLLSGQDLPEAIKEVNEVLNRNNQESLFVTSFIGIINFKKEEIRFVNAGHEKPYILSHKKIIKLDGESNFVLGCMDGIVYKEEKHKFHKGDIIFMFTDGLNESINDKEEEFSYKRIEDTLINSKGISLDEYISNMKQELSNFVGDNEQFDDVTMLMARFNDGNLSLSYDSKEASIITDALDRFENYFSYINNEKKSKVGIILDELLNNLISYEKRDDLHIDIVFSLEKDTLTIEIVCNGNDYDPFKNNKKKYIDDYSNDIEEGGFGVTIVESMSKSQKYFYKDNHSHIIIKL